MNNYNFKKLTIEQKWQEKDKLWVKNDPEEYIRLLIINDDISLLKKFEKLNHTISYNIKDGILLTLAMQKNSFAIIDYLLEHNLEIKQRDVEALIKNFREVTRKDDFIELLDKIDFAKIDLNAVFEQLEYYLDEESTTLFVEYLLESKIPLNDRLIETLKKEDNLYFLFKKQQKEKEYNEMNEKFSNKKILQKNTKI